MSTSTTRIDSIDTEYHLTTVSTCTKAFLTHHVANISTVVQAAVAHTVLSAAISRAQRLSHGFA